MIKLLVPAAFLLASAISPLKAEGDDFQRLVDALASEQTLMDGFESTAKTEMIDMFKADADMVELEETCPGLMGAMADAMMPGLTRSQLRGVREYRADLLALFRDRLGPDDARQAADFYASENGQKLVRLAGEHASVENIRGELLASENTTASPEAFAADKAATGRAIKNNMEPVLIREVGAELVTSEWFPRFMVLKPELDRLELELVNDDFTPEEDEEMDAALDAVLTARLDECILTE